MPTKASNPIPEGMNTVTTSLVFNGDCAKALVFYQNAFGAKVPFAPEKTPDGKVLHAMIKIGDSNIILSDTYSDPDHATGLKSNLWLYVKDCDGFYDKAIRAGCSATMPVEDAFWGDRVGQVKDPFGHTWNIASRKWILTPDELKEREQEWMRSYKEEFAHA
jgi:PhnB protein